jgi:hypothetical protein
MGCSGRAPDHDGRHGPSSGAIGQHNSGDDVDPLEVELLERFAQSVAVGGETARLKTMLRE